MIHYVKRIAYCHYPGYWACPSLVGDDGFSDSLLLFPYLIRFLASSREFPGIQLLLQVRSPRRHSPKSDTDSETDFDELAFLPGIPGYPGTRVHCTRVPGTWAGTGVLGMQVPGYPGTPASELL
eukprot:2753989-Rhodomonas_salina.1